MTTVSQLGFPQKDSWEGAIRRLLPELMEVHAKSLNLCASTVTPKRQMHGAGLEVVRKQAAGQRYQGTRHDQRRLRSQKGSLNEALNSGSRGKGSVKLAQDLRISL